MLLKFPKLINHLINVLTYLFYFTKNNKLTSAGFLSATPDSGENFVFGNSAFGSV